MSSYDPLDAARRAVDIQLAAKNARIVAASAIDLPGLIPLYMSGQVPQPHALARHLGWSKERIAKGVPTELHLEICRHLGPAMPNNPYYGEYQPQPFKHLRRHSSAVLLLASLLGVSTA